MYYITTYESTAHRDERDKARQEKQRVSRHGYHAKKAHRKPYKTYVAGCVEQLLDMVKTLPIVCPIKIQYKPLD